MPKPCHGGGGKPDCHGGGGKPDCHGGRGRSKSPNKPDCHGGGGKPDCHGGRGRSKSPNKPDCHGGGGKPDCHGGRPRSKSPKKPDCHGGRPRSKSPKKPDCHGGRPRSKSPKKPDCHGGGKPDCHGGRGRSKSPKPCHGGGKSDCHAGKSRSRSKSPKACHGGRKPDCKGKRLFGLRRRGFRPFGWGRGRGRKLPSHWFNWAEFGVPTTLIRWFLTGQLNWLTAERLALLQGGRWNPGASGWITAAGEKVAVGSAEWLRYFGPTFGVRECNILFGRHGGGWNEVFAWLSPAFLTAWTSQFGGVEVAWFTTESGSGVPEELMPFFEDGTMNWLNPERLALLQGGRWDSAGEVWVTPAGTQVKPDSPEWFKYFGFLKPGTLSLWFPNGGAWSEKFSFITSDFFERWVGWQGASGLGVPQYLVSFFEGGEFSWLTPERAKLLKGGRWDGAKWTTADGLVILPNSPEWTVYFGDFNPENFSILFVESGGVGSWDDTFSFIYSAADAFWEQATEWNKDDDDDDDDVDPQPPAPEAPEPVPVPKPEPTPPTPAPEPTPPTPAPVPVQSLNIGVNSLNIKSGADFNWSEFGVPQNYIQFFTSGQLNWLTPERVALLQGGRWDSNASVWITSSGQQVKFGSPEWVRFFGSSFGVEGMNLLFGVGGGSWNETFHWISPSFLTQWCAAFSSGGGFEFHSGGSYTIQTFHIGGGAGVLVPESLLPFFQDGRMNWLNPERFKLLEGGRWDAGAQKWITGSGAEIRPDSDEWVKYFGFLKAETLGTLFHGGDGSWNERFSFIRDSGFFSSWKGWEGAGGWGAPPNLAPFFDQGHLDWLTRERAALLKGGRWDGSVWTTKDGVVIAPNSTEWVKYFGDFYPANFRVLFATSNGVGSWDDAFGFLYSNGEYFWKAWSESKGEPAPATEDKPFGMKYVELE